MLSKYKGENEITIGDQLWCVKDCLEKGITVVTVTKIDKPGIYWADDDGHPYLTLDGCLLRALFLGYDVFLEYEDAAIEAQKICESEIRKLQNNIISLQNRIIAINDFKNKLKPSP